jgi:hypothetical protein
MAFVIVGLMLISLMPILPAQGSGVGYLVFRDTVPVGPDLDASFHAVVPEGVSVLAVDLHIYGTQGVLPVAADSAMAGSHDHNLIMAGPHAHTVSPSEGHDHPVDPSGDHDHQVTVYNSNVDTDMAKMSVDLPSHTHTFDGTTRIVDPYDFAAVTSNGHNHTVPAHTHNTLIGQGGDHGHVTNVTGDHDHDMPAVGSHDHSADVKGDHNHSLLPGWSQVTDGVRPSNVQLKVTFDDTLTDVPGTFGIIDSDWSDSIEMDTFIDTGVSTLTFTADSHGMLEYVLVVEIDHAYGVISGQGALGPGGELEIPIWTPSTTISAKAYLFGSDLPMAGMMADTAGNHSHEATAENDHDHSINPALDHTHLVAGGDHEHEGYAATSTPGTTSATPLWTLPTHRHDLSWTGQILTGMGNYNYGNEESNDHDHQVVDHDHFVTLNVSGAHDHNMSSEDIHTHVDELGGDHDHGTDMSADHDHPLVFSPMATTTGGPQGVTATVDGTDVTGTNGGPWTLSDTPTMVDVDPTSFADPISLNLSSTSEGNVEWVVLVELADPVIMVSAHGIAGDIVAHIPVPTVVGGAKVGALGSPYVMTLGDLAVDGGDHGHRSSTEGEHAHATTEEGNHSHDLATGGFHIHGMDLGETVVTVQDANATVDLQPHLHSAALGSQFSSQNMVGGTTGTHSHQTDPHVHDLNFTTEANHVHVANLTGNHTHDTVTNGSHIHSMSGGDHDHGLQPGVSYDQSFTSPADVNVQLGDSHPSVDLDGGGARWWDEFTVGAGHLDIMTVETLTASSGQVGKLSFVVWFLMDLQPPEPTLVFAPEWVAPGDSFSIIVGVPDDIDIGTVVLDIGPVVVDAMDHNATNFTIEFTCTSPANATEGMYDIDLTASDNVGNEATVSLGEIGIDGTQPVVTVTIGEPQEPGQGFTWVTSDTPVNMTIEDATSGPGDLMYAFDEAGPWMDYDLANNTVFDGQVEGDTTLYVSGVDVAENWAATQSFDVNIDDSGPVVTILVAPSVPGDGPGNVVASPDAIVSFTAEDGDGVGVDTIYYQIDGAKTEPVRKYDRPFPVSDVDMGLQADFTITWYAWDVLGNVDDGSEELTVKIDPVSAIPSPEGDFVVLPTHVTESPYTMQGNIPGNVAVFHYRIDGGSGGIVAIEAGATFDFIVNLVEGPNTLLYALETPVGVMSEWVVGGVIYLDTVPPELIGVDPAEGSKDIRTKGLKVSMHFSEPVTISTATAQVNGKDVEVNIVMHTDNTSATMVFLNNQPGNALIEVQLTFKDLAGHEVEDDWSYKTIAPGGGSDITGYLIGLVAGLIIGVMLMFFASFKRRDPGAIVHEGGVATTSIISPDEHMSWHEDDDEDDNEDEDEDDDGSDDDEDEDDDDDDDEDDGSEVSDDGDDYESEDEDVDDDHGEVESTQAEEEPEAEAEKEMEVPDDWEEGDISEDGVDSDPVPEPFSDDSDLEDEIDRLLEDATTSPDSVVEELPDPDAETVDPGSRF